MQKLGFEEEPPFVSVQKVSFAFGEGEARKGVLLENEQFDVEFQ